MSLAQWRDLAAVFISLQVFIVLLAPAAILAAALWGLHWVHRQIRRHAPRAHRLFRDIARVSDEVSQKIAAPMIAADAAAAGIRRTRSVTARAILPASPARREVQP